MLFNMTGTFMLLFTLHPLLHFLKASCSSSLSPPPSASSICSAGILEASESCRRGRPEARHASLEGAWQGRDATACKTNPGSFHPFHSLDLMVASSRFLFPCCAQHSPAFASLPGQRPSPLLQRDLSDGRLSGAGGSRQLRGSARCKHVM